jgi:hypothetical protein
VNSEGNKDGVRKLMIRRNSESEELGFSFRGGAEHKIGLYVSSVDDGTAAHKSGLKPGMQLLKANDVSLERVTSQDAIRILKGTKKIKLSIVDKGMYPGMYSAHTQYRWVDPAGRPVSPPPEPRDTDSRVSEGQPVGRSEMRLLSNSDERKVNVIVKNHQKLGISIRGGVDQGVGIYVSHVVENSVAEQAGLKAGDQILDVNGESFLKISHTEAASMLKSQDLMVMTIKDVGKIPHSTVKYDRAKWVYCDDKQTDEIGQNQRSATLPSHFRHKAGAAAQQSNPFFKEQPSSDFSTFKPSNENNENGQQSTVFKHGMGTQMVMRSTQVSTARAEVNNKAQAVLTEHELSSLNYYLSQYQDNHVTVDDLVRALLTILDTVEKAALLTEIRQIVVPRDVDQFESLTREKEIEVLRERRRLESMNRLKGAAMMTDSPPVRRQAVPGSSQVDIRQSPLMQRTALSSENGTYSGKEEGETNFGQHPLACQVATVAVVHNTPNRQLVRGEPQEEEESEDEKTRSADAMSDVSDTAVLVAVNAISEAVDETNTRERDEEPNETNDEREETTYEVKADQREEETQNEGRQDTKITQAEKKEDENDEMEESEESSKLRERVNIPIAAHVVKTEVYGEPAIFHVPTPPDKEEVSESEDEEEKQSKQEKTSEKAEVIHPPTKSIEQRSSLPRYPPVFMVPPPPSNEPASMSSSPPIFHVPPPPSENYSESSDEEHDATHTEQECEDQLHEQNEIISPDPQRVLEEKMQQRRKWINPGSVYVRKHGSRVSLDSTMTDVSVEVDETWDQSLHDGSMNGHSVTTSTPRKHTLTNMQEIPDMKQETTITQSIGETATDDGESVPEKTVQFDPKDSGMERDEPDSYIEQTVPVLFDKGINSQNHENQSASNTSFQTNQVRLSD